GVVEVTIKEMGYTKALRPGNEVVYDKSDRSIIQRTTDISRIGLWRTGVYAFEEISILELTKDLEQLYPIHFTFEGSVPQQLFNGEVVRDDDWKKVLKKLEMTNRVRFEIIGNEVVARSQTEEKKSGLQ